MENRESCPRFFQALLEVLPEIPIQYPASTSEFNLIIRHITALINFNLGISSRFESGRITIEILLPLVGLLSKNGRFTLWQLRARLKLTIRALRYEGGGTCKGSRRYPQSSLGGIKNC